MPTIASTNHTELVRRRASQARVRSYDGSRSRLPRTVLDQSSTEADAARLQERARIARELHDGVSQTLYAIGLAASRALAILERASAKEVEPSLHDVLTLANAGQSELRALLMNIGTGRESSRGLVEALTSLAATFRTHDSWLDIRLVLAVDPELPAATQRELVLIAREALRNIVRHSGASRADIALLTPHHEIMLQITDDGCGFDQGETRPGHWGLQSMRERATACGGRLDVKSIPGAGTQVIVRVPRLVID